MATGERIFSDAGEFKEMAAAAAISYFCHIGPPKKKTAAPLGVGPLFQGWVRQKFHQGRQASEVWLGALYGKLKPGVRCGLETNVVLETAEKSKTCTRRQATSDV